MAETNPVAFAQTLSDNYDLGPSNTDATGITELNGKIYVVDSGDNKIFAYNADGTRDSASDVNLGSNNGNSAGITALHGKLLVVDNNDGKVYAYNPNDSRASSSDFPLHADNGNPNGITALHGNLWIVDNTANKVFVYNPDGTLVSSSEIGLSSDNGDSKGITALHDKLWVVDRTDNIVYVYNSDGTQDSSFEFALDAANASATGITTLHGKIWVVDNAANKVYVYDDVQAPLAFNFRTDEDNNTPDGITALNGKFWVLDSNDEKVYAYNADGTRAATSFDFDLHSTNDSPFGITALNGKLWVVDSDDDKVYAYNADGTRVSGSDFNLDTDNSSPDGITSFNGKFYVVDRNTSTDKVYAYNADGTRAASLDFDLPSDNSSPFGITALYDKFYIVDIDGYVYAYNAATRTPDTSSNFFFQGQFSPKGITSLYGKLWVVYGNSPDSVYPFNPDGTRDLLLNINLDTDNGNPSGITAWNSTLWVVDELDSKVYAYNRTDGIAGSELDFDLNGNNDDPTGITSTSTSTSTSLGDKFWVVDATDTKVYAYDVDGTRAAASFDINLASSADSLFGVTFLNDKFWVADLDDAKIYAYNSDGTRAASSDITLSSDHSNPAGITALDDNLWVLDIDKVYAYNSDGTRAASLDFDLDAVHSGLTGITALDDRFWIVDTNDKIYSYDVPTPDTTDTIDPTLSAVSISSDNTNDTTRATLGNTVTLDFTSSENIETPIVTIHGVASDAVTGSGDTWSATKTITSGDADGPVTFTIDFTDLAANDGTQVTSITTGSGVTVDQTAPTLTTVSIESNNSNDTTMATLGDTITLSFTSDEPIETPTVTINGVTVSAVIESGNTWSATKTTTPADADGPVTFRITFTDLAANDGIAVTSPTADNSGVTVNKTAPTLIAVSIESNNSDTSRATLDDIITLSFTSSESIGTPDVTINGITATVAPAVAGSTTSWSATKAITAADNDGAVEFTIDFTDLATNDGIQITSITTGSGVTVDQTAPELTTVSIESNNSLDTTLATAGNTVTLSFTSDEPILPPTVTINGDTVTATVLGGDTTTWSAETTIASTDADGVVDFSISFFDLASNDGGIATSPTAGNSDVTVDNTAPTLTTVSIESDNADPSRATTGDTVTLTFTSLEPIEIPNVTIDGDVPTTLIGNSNDTIWSATKTITAADVDGSAVTFTIDFTDWATNAGTQVTATDDSSAVTVYQPTLDTTPPILTAVSIESNNSNDTTMATLGNTITLSFTSDEDIETPTVTINTVTATVVPAVAGSTTSWSATKAITAADDDGAVEFTIDFTDLATNDGIQVTSITTGSGVTVDQTAPTLTTVSIESNNTNDTTLATDGNTVTLSFTSDEPILPPTVTINGDTVTATVLGGDTTTWSAETTIASTDDDGVVAFSITYSDLASNDGGIATSLTAGNPGVTVDNTAPELDTVSIVSDNTDTSTATTDDTITLEFTSSEPIQTPAVTFGGISADTVNESGNTWSATKIITSADADGSAVTFDISFSDLATNAGTSVTSTTDSSVVTVYQTAPDTTDPELNIVSIESNNSDTSRATLDNIITLSFTSSEPIETPDVTINGDIAAAASGSGNTWSATKTITSGDADGPVTFTIDFSDLADPPNGGTQVTSITTGSGVTVDQTAPTLTTVSIESNNTNDTTLATDGNTVTLSFTSDEPILPPTVTINGDTVTATVLGGDTTTWSAETTIASTDDDGVVAFSITYSDLASNDGGIATSPTAGNSDVTVDNTAPTLTTVSIESDNADPSRATTGDTVTLTFTSSEPIEIPNVTIDGDVPTTLIGNSNDTIWSATKTITAADVDGSAVTFTIDFTDWATNAGTQVTATDDSSAVTVYQPTLDTTPPILTVVSIESNNSDTSRATTDNTITLSFTSSEPIGTPTVTINTATATVTPAVTGSTTSWSATKIITAADNDGAVAFTIDFSDLADPPNDGTPVTGTIGGSSVTVDQTAPTLTAVSIASNNSNPSRATTDDIVTLSFTSSENIGTPIVTFGGVTATVTGSTTSWSATKTITAADADDSIVTFAINYSDLATNAGTQVTSITTGSSVTVYQTAPDTTAPTLTTVSIVSNNSNDPSRATTGDTVTLSFTSSEPIGTPTVTINTATATVTPAVAGSTTSWSATKTITSADSDGAVEFTIDFSDLAATPNVGTQVTATEDGTSVTVDTTAPTLSLVSIVSNNADPSRATTDNTVTLSFTSSEPILEPTVTFGGVDASAVIGGDNTSWSATKTITSADADGSTVTFAIDFTDLATNGGISITGPTDSTSVTVYQTAPDTTAPTLTVVSIESDNSNDSSLATTDNTITLSFTSSEPIGTPTVTINTATATVVPAAPGSTTSWSAETTITSTDDDGVVTFTIDFSDLAATSNDGTPVTDTTDNTGVTVDNTAPTRNSRGSNDDSKTRPTFGISGQTFAQIVNCGYSMDGVCTNVTEYHVDYNRQIIQTGTTHDFALKAYAQNGMKSFVIGFGVNEVGAPASESEASITVNLGRDYTLDSTYTIDSVEYDNDENVIGENATFAVSGVSCNGGGGGSSDDDNDNDNDGDSSIIQKDQTQCTQLLIDGVLFREAMYDEPFMIEAVDAKRKVITHYMNEGLQIIGESINEPPTHKFSSKKTSQSDAVILELTRTDKLKNIWTDQFGYTWSADTPDEWYYVDGPVLDNSSACDSMDHRVCDAFAEKLKYHTSKMESLRDSMYGDIYVAEPFDDLDEVVTFLMTPGESRTQFLDDNAMMWIRN